MRKWIERSSSPWLLYISCSCFMCLSNLTIWKLNIDWHTLEGNIWHFYLPSLKLIKASQRMQRTMPLPNIVDYENLKLGKFIFFNPTLPCPTFWIMQRNLKQLKLQLSNQYNCHPPTQTDGWFTKFKDSFSTLIQFASGISSLCFLQSNAKKVKVSHGSTRTYLWFPIFMSDSYWNNLWQLPR